MCSPLARTRTELVWVAVDEVCVAHSLADVLVLALLFLFPAEQEEEDKKERKKER
jgi:hypothetical protein